jgi:hypothetical protein
MERTTTTPMVATIGAPHRRVIAALAVAIGSAAGICAATKVVSADPPVWKGAESLAPVAIGPDVTRCGAFPRNLEAHFAGSGIDTNGGPFSVTVSGCLDTTANVLSNLAATDTYARSGEALFIAPADTPLIIDHVTCVATNPQPVRFNVTGGTGRFAGARGTGTYEIAFTLPTCPGLPQQVFVWFRGHLETTTNSGTGAR